jgi:Legionella pneumophila major outer membrane protein precursor
MKKMMKTIFALAAVSAVSAQADQMQPKMPAQATVPNPSARWGVTDGANLFITAEALVFKIAQDQTPYAYTYNNGTYDTQTYGIKPKYEWGFRVAAGYNMSHDKWDIVATYSRFNFNESSNVTPGASESLHSYFDYYVVDGNDASYDLDSAKAKWHVNFNMLDVELGRQFFVSKFLRIRPKFGLRNVWLNNDTTVKAVYETTENWELKDTENFWGMGVLAGIDTVWGLAKGFSIYGNFGLSGLFGYFDPDQKVAGGEHSEQHYLEAQRQDMTKATLDLALGLRWDKNFYDDRYHIGFNFGFEQHVFFNMTRNYLGEPSFTNYVGLSGRDFTMSGFAFGARFDF